MEETQNYKLFCISVSIASLGALYYGYRYKTGVYSMKGGEIIGGTLAVIILIWVIGLSRNISQENYGGPIRNTRKIPMTDCYKFCDTNYGMCKHMYPGDNVGKCHARWRACRMECYFPNVQRMY